jgi:hypothetical protein
VGKPGVWVFRIDDSIIHAPTPPPTSPLPNTVATQASTVPITVPSYSPKPTPSAAPTTPAGSSNSSNPLSNSDGTPCGCNNAGLWLDLLLVIDRSAGVGEDGMTDVRSFFRQRSNVHKSRGESRKIARKVHFSKHFFLVRNSRQH